MPRTTITVRVGLTAAAASFATALAGPGGAAAVSQPQVIVPVATPAVALSTPKVVEAIRQDVAETTAAVEREVQEVKATTEKVVAGTAPRTRAAVRETVADTAAAANRVLRDTSDSVSKITEKAKADVDVAVESTKQRAGTAVRRTRATAEIAVEDARRTIGATVEQLTGMLYGHRVFMKSPLLGDWSLFYSRTDGGCVEAGSSAPWFIENPKLKPRRHLGVDTNGLQVRIAQDGGKTSAEAGC